MDFSLKWREGSAEVIVATEPIKNTAGINRARVAKELKFIVTTHFREVKEPEPMELDEEWPGSGNVYFSRCIMD
ncbi:MAG: hypothetical protein NVS9B14_23240 [Candidatus Acidiferrum sp.]